MKYQDLLKSNPEIFDNTEAFLTIVTDENIINSWTSNKKDELQRNGLPQNWGEIGVVYEDQYIVILRDLVRLPDGNLGSHIRILHSADLRGGQATVILPIIDNKILLLRQFRHPTRMWHLEFPRGFGKPNTSPEENAKDELLEEIGAEIFELENLGEYHSNTGFIGARVQLYLARLKSIGLAKTSEGIESYDLFDLIDVEAMIRESEITDGYTIAAFVRARLKGLL